MRLAGACWPAAAILLCACAGGPSPPAWQTQSQSSLENFRQRYLEGNSAAATRAFARARSEVAATGKPEFVARVELVRCALGVASLDFDACSESEKLRDDASTDERAYGDFLAARWKDLDVSRLPAQYREIALSRDAGSGAKLLQRIEDPVSRLVAAGALFRSSSLTPEGVATAVDAASAQGYRRPLLAWLNVQATQAQAAGDSAAQEAIRKRIEFVHQSLSDSAHEQPR